MGLIKSYSCVIENIGIIRSTITPIRLTRLQLARLFLLETWRNVIYFSMSFYSSMAEKYSRFVENIGIIGSTLAPIRLSRWQLTKLFLAQIWREAGLLARIVLVLLAVTVSAITLDRLIRPKSLETLGIPVGGSSTARRLNFSQVLQDSKAKYPNQPFLIRAFGVEYVVFPSLYFDEIKKLPEDQASALAFLGEFFNEPWSGIPRQTAELIQTISVDLARAIPTLVSARQVDCAAACDKVIGATRGWKEITLFAGMQEIVASTNASAFVGSELGTNRKWTRSVERLPMAALIATVLLSYLPIILRPLFKPVLYAPAIWLRWNMASMLTPLLQDDIREYEQSSDKRRLLGPKEKGKAPITAWLLSRYKPSQATMKRLTDDFITMSFESTASSAGTLFFIMGELAADPALADTLREEIIKYAPDGKLPSTHLSELRKMDSVMRESTRANPFSHLSLYRKLRTSVQLSNGPKLPSGTNICVDAHHINFSPTTYPNPFSFSGLRHYEKRQTPGKDQRFKFASLGSDSPGWGDGLQACPGRLFADNTLKIILTHLLLRYDFRLREGEGKPKKGDTPNGTMYPDMWAKILFRSRS